jgi:outer membrane protein OmpA-like peptidoglycan-associated protein
MLKYLVNKRSVMTYIFLLLLSTLLMAQVETEILSFHDHEPSTDELIRAFMGDKTVLSESHDKLIEESKDSFDELIKKPAKYRGLSIKKVTEGKDNGLNACQASSQSVAVNIHFLSGSSDIETQDSQLLQKIAQAMNTLQLKNCLFVIEGHTDAVGEAFYNLDLSKKRAVSVQYYLAQYHVAINRLMVIGKGENELLTDHHPNAAENRRVQFRIINSIID